MTIGRGRGRDHLGLPIARDQSPERSYVAWRRLTMMFSLIRQGTDTRFGPSDEGPMFKFECPRLRQGATGERLTIDNVQPTSNRS